MSRLALFLALGLLQTPAPFKGIGLASTNNVCTANCRLKVGQAFTLAAAHDGNNTIGYRVHVDDGVRITTSELPLSALTGGTIGFAFPAGLDRGKYKLTIAAFNDANIEAVSSPLAATVR